MVRVRWQKHTPKRIVYIPTLNLLQLSLFPPFLKTRARDSSSKVETLQHAWLQIDINQLFTQ